MIKMLDKFIRFSNDKNINKRNSKVITHIYIWVALIKSITHACLVLFLDVVLNVDHLPQDANFRDYLDNCDG